MLNKAYIDLGVLQNNALAVKDKLNKGVKLCAVVKADAYGHGASECAKALYPVVDAFAVALVEEGVALRLSGVDKDILVLIPPFECDLFSAVHYGLILAVCSGAQLEAIGLEAKRQGKQVKVHIKVNTGMNRQGADNAEELLKILCVADKYDEIIIDGVFSHFANLNCAKSRNQALSKFLLAIKGVRGYNNKVTAHISASGGFLSGVQLDMVRIGILLYGYKPFESDLVSVRPVMSVRAPIVSRRCVHKGEGVLYGDFVADRDLSFALVRYGYADGLPRRCVTGQVNNRCMDLTAVKGSFDGVNDVEVLGNADALSSLYQTINYEILCRAGSRAEKIYLR